MKSNAETPDEYIASLPDGRREVVGRLRGVILENLPEGFEEVMSYGMLGYVVPHSIYPSGYHCDPALPLPFINLASQKRHVGLYHMALYAGTGLLEWFQGEYPKHCEGKLDMGKCCVRFRKMEAIPYGLIGELCRKMTPQEWVAVYEESRKE